MLLPMVKEISLMIARNVLCSLLLVGSVTFLSASGGNKVASIKKEDFGQVEGRNIELYTLTNRNGLEAKIATYGGVLVSLKVPDRNGKLDVVVLGFDNIDRYLRSSSYIGAVIGRYGNRIAKGRFTLNGTEYKLATNNG